MGSKFLPRLTTARIQNAPTVYLKFDGGAFAHLSFSPGEDDYCRISISSDWGSWSTGWRQENIYKFLLSCDDGYIFKNFKNMGRVYDHQLTVKEIKKQFKGEYLVGEEKEAINRELKDLKHDNYENIDHFMSEFSSDYPAICKYFPEWFTHMGITVDHPREVFFFKHVYPKFKPYLRKLAKEQEKALSLKKKQENANGQESGKAVLSSPQV